MKILAFTDTHLSFKSFKRIKGKVKKQKPDLILCAGDISIFENGLDFMLKQLNKFKLPTLIVHGNHETESFLRKLSKKYKNVHFIHKIHYKTDNVIVFGYGGGGFAMTDSGFKKISKKFSRIIKKNKDKKIIFMTHAPPYRTKLDKIGKHYVGNKTFREFIEKSKVDLVVSGHLHENFGKKDKIKKTEVINPGPYGKIMKL